MDWRLSFTIAGLAGAAGVLLLTPSFERATGQATVARLLRFAVAPLYLRVALVAAVPAIGSLLDGPHPAAGGGDPALPAGVLRRPSGLSGRDGAGGRGRLGLTDPSAADDARGHA